MSAEPAATPGAVRGFGRAVRLASPHAFHSAITREQAMTDPGYLKTLRRRRILSVLGWIALLALFVWLRGWAGERIAAAFAGNPAGPIGWLELAGAVLLLFLGAFAFMRLGQIALRAMLDADDPSEWPREGVDWGQQTVTLDRDSVSVGLRYVRRSYPWESLAELTEDDVFVLERRHGDRIVIPKDPADEEELRERLLRGIMLAEPLR